MQGIVDFALILRQISLGVFLFGLFYTFGMFALGRLFEILSDVGEHDIDVDTDAGEGLDYDGSVEADVESDISLDHDIGGDMEHDIEAPSEPTIDRT